MIALKRPLVFFDLETTGPEKETDRIVQFAALKMMPDGTERRWQTLINPGVPIPEPATEVHGITDAMVASAPTFAAVAGKIWGALLHCDLAGYNARRFDVPLLIAEYNRLPGYEACAGDLAIRAIVDPMRIFMQREPRDLGAAHRFFLGETLEGAHDAMADTVAAQRVFLAQLERYELPNDVDELSALCAEDAVDLERKLVWKDGEIVVSFGKMRGKSLGWLFENDPGFLRWLLDAKNSFPIDTKTIVAAHRAIGALAASTIHAAPTKGNPCIGNQ